MSSDLLGSMWNFISSNPLLILAILFFAFQLYQRSLPFPEVEGSKVKDLKTMEDFKAVVGHLGKAVLVVDFYAKWCPPCKAAAPIFAEWSKTYDPAEVLFAKVDVDSAASLARHFGISAMPTFKIFDNSGKEVRSFVGWRKSELELFLKDSSKTK